MKKQNLLFSLLLLGMGIGLFSCNIGNGGNITKFPTTPAVINSNTDIFEIAIGTQWGYCAAPSLESYEGSCAILSFAIDFDNQPPSLNYSYTASAINISEIVPQRSLEMAYDSVHIDDYMLPISSAAYVSSPFYNGKIFMGIASKDNNPNFRLVFNMQEPDSAGIKNLYLLAQPSSSSAVDIAKNYAFDVLSLIQYYGRDTTITDNNGTLSYRYVKANLKYFTGMSKDEVPVPTYNTLNNINNPLIFLIFNNQ